MVINNHENSPGGLTTTLKGSMYSDTPNTECPIMPITERMGIQFSDTNLVISNKHKRATFSLVWLRSELEWQIACLNAVGN